MWAIRMLTGSHSGEVFPLKEGKNLFGRSAHCQIRVNDLDVSKEHAWLMIEGERLSVVDNQSRNGTYVNGVMVNRATLKRGDKVSFNQTICDIVQIPTTSLHSSQGQSQGQAMGSIAGPVVAPQGMMPISSGGAPNPLDPPIPMGAFPHSGPMAGAPQYGPPGAAVEIDPETGLPVQTNFFKRYFEEVVMPGVFYLGQIMEFKLVIGLFLLIFAVLVTALSTIPMLAITSDSIQLESRRRALTIARNLANVNQQALLKEMDSAVSTQLAELEEGVSQAFIIRQSDGTIIAPAARAGSLPAIAFIDNARREQKEMVEQIDSSRIAVAVPLAAFSPETATYVVKALAVVVYDMGTLAVDDGRTLSLFFQTLIISLLLGSVIYYLFYRFMEQPIVHLNQQVDSILKSRAEPMVNIDLDFPALQNLAANINTILTRMTDPNEEPGGIGFNKDLEMINIIRLVGYASLAISSDSNIIGLNQAAEHLLGLSDHQLRNQPVTLIPDQALQKSIYDLMEHASRDPAIPSRNELDFGGENTEINCQAITDKGRIGYYIITIIPMGGGAE